jgi:hypothetical protein
MVDGDDYPILQVRRRLDRIDRSMRAFAWVVAFAMVAGPADLASASPASPPPTAAEIILEDAGATWAPSPCPPNGGAPVGDATACFDAERGVLQIVVQTVPEAGDPDTYVDATIALIGGKPLDADLPEHAQGRTITHQDGGVEAYVVMASGTYVLTFATLYQGTPRQVADLLLDVVERQRRRIARLSPTSPAPSTTTPEVRPSAADVADLDARLLELPPGSGLSILATVDAAPQYGIADLLENRRVVRILQAAPSRLRMFGSGTPTAFVLLARERYDIFAASEIGALGQLPPGRQLRLPVDLGIQDAIGVRFPATRPNDTEQLGIWFRKGRYVALVAVAPEPGADHEATLHELADLARRQADRLPDGASAPYTFPSTTRAVALTLAFSTVVCGGALGLGRLAAARQRRRTRPPAAVRPRGVPSPHTVDVSDIGRSLRRRGLVLALTDVAAVDAVIVGVLALVGTIRIGTIPALALVVAGLAGGAGFTTWWSRRELSRPGARVTAGGPSSQPSAAGVAAGIVALALLVIGAAALATGIGGLTFGPSLRDLEWSEHLRLEPRRLAMAEAVLGAVALVAAAGAVRLARMWARSSGARLRARDQRPPILYLRAFKDDALRLPTIVTARRPFLELFTLRGTDPFEEALTWHIGPYGPVVAIGRPGRPLQSLGAARDHMSDAAWRQEVADRMGEARVIVVVVDVTDGLAWELSWLASAGHLERAVLVFPPTDPAALRARYQAAVTALSAGGRVSPPLPAPPEQVLTAVMGPDGWWPVVVAAERDEATYRAALDVAMASATRARPTPVGTPF